MQGQFLTDKVIVKGLINLSKWNFPAGVEIKSTPAGFHAGVNFLYETESNIHFMLGGDTFHAKRGA